MATQAKLGKGTIVKVGDGASPEVYTAIPEVLTVDGGPGGTAGEVSVLNHDSVGMWDETLSTLITGNTITVTANWNKTGASGNTVLLGLKDAVGGAAKNFQIILPTTTPETITFAALVQSFTLSPPTLAQMTASIVLKSTALPVWS